MTFSTYSAADDCYSSLTIPNNSHSGLSDCKPAFSKFSRALPEQIGLRKLKQPSVQKNMRYLTISFVGALAILTSPISLQAEPASPEQARVWTPTATGKGTTGTLIKKAADNSSIVIKLQNGRELTVQTSALIQADRDYVAKWQEPVVGTRGIVRGERGGALSQAQGGKSRPMKDLQSVLSEYGKAEEDTKPHPDALIYRGPAWTQRGGEISISYLMPRAKALALLVERPGQVASREASAPGFPPGMKIYEYDINSGVYNRMMVVVDQADQVVALQAQAETKNDPTVPGPGWKPAAMPMNSTSDFLDTRTGGATAHVLDLRAKEKRIVIDLETGRRETLLFLPEPMVNLCLFHISQDIRK